MRNTSARSVHTRVAPLTPLAGIFPSHPVHCSVSIGSGGYHPPGVRSRSLEELRGPAQPVNRGEGPNGFSYFVLSAPHFIKGLQIHPELCARAEEVGESNRGVSGDRAAPVEDLSNAVRRYVQMSSQACGAES